MEAYYSNQASQSMPHFSAHYRQRGSGFGALAAGIGRVALPLARKFLWPAAKKIGRDWNLKLLVIATILLTYNKFTWRSSVEYFKHMERIFASQLVTLMPVIFHILLIISFIHFSPTVLFLQMVSKFQQLMDTMHTKVS